MVQVIPFKRDTMDTEAEIRAETMPEKTERERVLNNTKSVEGWYRTDARERR